MRTPTLIVLILGAAIVLAACSGEKKKEASTEIPTLPASNALTFEIKNLTDEEYPDNPDIGFRSANYQSLYFTTGSLKPSEDQAFVVDLSFISLSGDTLQFSQLDLSEYIPTIPTAIKGHEYLSYIACINQEWNRNQVRVETGEFETTDKEIVRVDVARNCLNAYLWEVIAYVTEHEKQVPYAHGWFNFPNELYAQLFEEKNGVAYSKYQKPLEDWVDPESQVIDLDQLRTSLSETPIGYKDQSDAMYPKQGAREKKFKEIIYPESFETMRDLQTDKSLFATFSQPGFYNRKDPRTTQLGRFRYLMHVSLNQIVSKINGDTLQEFQLEFKHRHNKSKTVLVLGGLDFDDFPVLPPEEANSGWKSSMGIGNHTFYETYAEHQGNKCAENPYYAVLLDHEGKWLDSHKIGIDGPIFHFEDEDRTLLHLWLLSFERHALVGHYVFKLK